jgi:4-aminobutyrate aminotransferase-like enzyme
MHKRVERPTASKLRQWHLDNAGVEDLLALEARYCSYGDTVHYRNTPKVFERCNGSFLYDGDGREFLDLQMWYSAVNFGYRNPRLDAAARRQLDRLPQLASQYLHREKIELAALIAQDAERKFGMKGRVHFNVGGSQAIEDSLKLVRNYKKGKSLMFAFEGGYHGRLGHHIVLPLPPALRPFRRSRPFRAVPLPFPRAEGHEQGGVRPPLRSAVRTAV